LSKGRTREQLVDELVAKYGIDSQNAQLDVDTFLAALRKHGLLA
jgi:hypothetical protein